MKDFKQNIKRILLFLIFIAVLIHFSKDITQDILHVASPLDLFGDIQEDISFLPNTLQLFFYYGFGGLSFISEGFLLITIPKIIIKQGNPILERWVYISLFYLVIFLLTCLLLDPRFVSFRR